MYKRMQHLSGWYQILGDITTKITREDIFKLKSSLEKVYSDI